jgi:hypothetical protein
VLHQFSMLLLWLVVLSAIASAVQYFMKFWTKVDASVKQRRLRLRILARRKKQQDVATP